MPTGRVKWYDAAKGFGFVTSDEGGDVFLPKGALPTGTADLKAGQRLEFGVVDSRKGAQAMSVKVVVFMGSSLNLGFSANIIAGAPHS